MVNISVYEPKKQTESLDINDLEILVTRELGENFAQSDEDELINFVVAKEKVETGHIVAITIESTTKFYTINDFGYTQVNVKNDSSFDLKALAEMKNSNSNVDLKDLAKKHRSKKKVKVRVSVLKKLAENKKIIKERDSSKQQ